MTDLTIGRHTILIGDVRERLRDLPDDSVHCVVTSPPYFNLRDYNVPGQIGLEPTLAEYIATMVDVFREVRRVLRPDGTCWLNIGSSYAGGGGYSPDSPSNRNGSRQSTNAGSIKGRAVGSNFTNAMQRFMKGCPLVIGNAGTIRVTGKRGDVPLHDDGLPEGVFLRLLGVERITIKQRDNDFCQVLHTLNGPRDCRIDVPVCFVRRNATDMEVVLDAADHVRIVVSDVNADSEPVFRVARVGGVRSGKDDERPLSVEQTGEPEPKVIGDGESIGNPVAFDAPLERFPDVYLVDEAVSLGDRLDATAGDCGHFRVAQSGRDQITLTLGHRRVEIVSAVRHFYSLNAFGSLVHCAELYDKATREANALQPKQDIGVPWRLAIALQEDGWILRSPIIWHKRAPMPESVRDRPTSAHEHIFLLTKANKYFYDADAVREPWESGRDDMRTKGVRTGLGYLGSSIDNSRKDAEFGDGARVNGESPLGRNQRNVWTLGPEPFPEAHFATFPTEIPRRAIKAGTSERGVCASCGAPWVRQTEKTVQFGSGSGKAGNQPNGKYQGAAQSESGTYDIRMGPQVQSVTTGWAPSCACDADAIPATVLDPFLGSGTTMLVADQLGRTCVGVELNPEYARMAEKRVRGDAPLLLGVA